MKADKNFTAVHVGEWTNLRAHQFKGVEGKYFVGQELGLTGSEISLNRLPAGQGMPFVHSHKQNEEVYLIIGGQGLFFVDGEEFPVQEGSVIRVAPAGQRALTATDSDLYFICLQTEAGSLRQATLQDGVIEVAKASWM